MPTIPNSNLPCSKMCSWRSIKRVEQWSRRARQLKKELSAIGLRKLSLDSVTKIRQDTMEMGDIAGILVTITSRAKLNDCACAHCGRSLTTLARFTFATRWNRAVATRTISEDVETKILLSKTSMDACGCWLSPDSQCHAVCFHVVLHGDHWSHPTSMADNRLAQTMLLVFGHMSSEWYFDKQKGPWPKLFCKFLEDGTAKRTHEFAFDL